MKTKHQILLVVVGIILMNIFVTSIGYTDSRIQEYRGLRILLPLSDFLGKSRDEIYRMLGKPDRTMGVDVMSGLGRGAVNWMYFKEGLELTFIFDESKRVCSINFMDYWWGFPDKNLQKLRVRDVAPNLNCLKPNYIQELNWQYITLGADQTNIEIGAYYKDDTARKVYIVARIPPSAIKNELNIDTGLYERKIDSSNFPDFFLIKFYEIKKN